MIILQHRPFFAGFPIFSVTPHLCEAPRQREKKTQHPITHSHQDLLARKVPGVRQFIRHAFQPTDLLSNVGAVVQEDLMLVKQLVRLRRRVPDVQVLGEEEVALLGQPERHALRILLKQAQLIDLFQASAHRFPLLLEMPTELVQLGHRLFDARRNLRMGKDVFLKRARALCLAFNYRFIARCHEVDCRSRDERFGSGKDWGQVLTQESSYHHHSAFCFVFN